MAVDVRDKFKPGIPKQLFKGTRVWDANSERLRLQAAKRGQLKMGTLKQLMAEIEGNQPEETKLLSLRIAVSDIERAKAQAEKKGIGYQTYLKSLLHQALTANAAPRWAVARSGAAWRPAVVEPDRRSSNKSRSSTRVIGALQNSSVIS